MKIAYIAHPISGDPKGNLEKIAAIVRDINLAEPNVVPFVPYYADIIALDDNVPEERKRGIRNDTAILESGVVDEIRLYGPKISKGMAEEVLIGFREFIKIRPMTDGTKRDFNN